MNPIFFLSLFFHTAMAATCGGDTPPHALDRANAKNINQLQAGLRSLIIADGEACEQNLAAKKADIKAWVAFLDQNVDHMAAEEEKWAQGILTKKIPMNAPPAAACAFDRDLTELEEFYTRAEARMLEFDSKFTTVSAAILNVRAEREIFGQPKKAQRLLDCRDELRERYSDFDEAEVDEQELADRREICLSRTGAPPELWEAVLQLEQNWEGTAVGLTCALDPKAKKFVRDNLKTAEQIEADAKKLHHRLTKYFDFLREKIPPRVREIQAARKGLAAWKCAEWRAVDDRKIESSIRKLQATDLHGTGFVLEGERGQPELLSARHVGFVGETFKSNQLSMLGIHAEKQPRRGIEFEVKPGYYDRGRDLVKHPLTSARTKLKAVPDGTVMAVGEKVRIFGYPANREGQFTSHGCEIKGIGRNSFDTPTSESYLLFCPGAESHIAGMSGGPVLNEKGEVIGVISAHNSITNMVVVQPVSRAPSGENRFGFQDIFFYDHCFSGSDISAPRRCQIIPGITYDNTAY